MCVLLLVDIQHSQCPSWGFILFILERYKLCGHKLRHRGNTSYALRSAVMRLDNGRACHRNGYDNHKVHTSANQLPAHWKRESITREKERKQRNAGKQSKPKRKQKNLLNTLPGSPEIVKNFGLGTHGPIRRLEDPAVQERGKRSKA